jgi:DNA-binding CsgD family transcriptional regulator
MGKNYAIERAKFERQQRQQAELYRKLGRDEEQIQTMYEFDLATFRSDWRYEKHTQGFAASSFGDGTQDESKSALFEKFLAQLSVQPDDGHSREWWVEEIENPQLALALKGLSKSDLEFITRIVIEKATQMELSEELGISQQAVSKKWRKMKKILK